MHIEPGLVADSKIWLSYVTAAGAGAYGLKLAWEDVKERGPVSLLARAAAATSLVFCFFEVLPHYPVGVSEVHLIFGSTLFLIFGAAPAAIVSSSRARGTGGMCSRKPGNEPLSRSGLSVNSSRYSPGASTSISSPRPSGCHSDWTT